MTSSSWASLKVRVEERPEAVLLFPSGEIDLATASDLWSSLNAVLEDGYSAVVVLNGITYIDSTGIKALLDMHRSFLERGQRLVLADPSPVVRRLIGIVGLERAIPIDASLDVALQSMRGSLGSAPPGTA